MTVSAAAKASSRPPASQAGYGFGMFKGVFMPSILTILGVIMFLRFPWVLGSVGLAGTFLIVTLSVAITLLTGLSIAAMATNMRVGGGDTRRTRSGPPPTSWCGASCSPKTKFFERQKSSTDSSRRLGFRQVYRSFLTTAIRSLPRHFRQAELLFLGLRPIGEHESLDDYAAYYASLSCQTDGLPPTALVNAGEEVDLHRLFAGI